jgi:hypothetical protein
MDGLSVNVHVSDRNCLFLSLSILLEEEVGITNKSKKRYNQFVLLEGQIIQPPTRTPAQVENERNIYVLYTVNHLHYPLKFQRDFCKY